MQSVETQIQILTFINQSSLFKGPAILLLGIMALAFVWYVKKRGESWQAGIIVFALIASLLVLYGLFVTIFQPHWWLPPR